jgi:RecA/RadA recombinase
MSTIIGIMGESGAGKSTSIRNLDPKKTFIIDADRKGLPFKGWKQKYNKENKNYTQTSDMGKIEEILSIIDKNTEYSAIECVIIDTINACMLDLEMSRMKEKGYDKWQDLAQDIYEMLSKCLSMRQNLYVICIAHVEDIQDDNGGHCYRIQTSGKKLQKIRLESKMTTVLFAKAIGGKYVFETQSNFSTAKSPMELFSETQIPNDLKFVIDKYKEYESDFPFIPEIKKENT